MDIFEEITKLKHQGRRAALATIINVRGSVPSEATAKMLVLDDGSILGTVGGGCVEGEVRRGAQEVMRDEKPRIFTFNLDQTPNDDTSLICGGSLQIFVEPIVPSSPLYVFGGGHVGLAISKVASLAGFAVTIVEDRETYANRERFPHAHDVVCGDWDSVLARMAVPESAFLAIVTRGHHYDLRVLRWALETPARYIGMIGSGRKVMAIFDQLAAQGVSRQRLERVYAPIGLEIGAVTPEEIAVSVVAEIIAIRRRSAEALPHSRNRIREHVLSREPAESVAG